MRKQRNSDKYILYLNAWENTLKEYQENLDIENRTMYIQRLVFYGVKAINLTEKSNHITRKAAENNFQFGSIIKSLVGLLTPGEFMQVFPIAKEYKGQKRGMKDYFYTRDYINTLDPNEPIGEEQALMFLWEYTNWDITMFNVNLMGYMSDLRELEGYPSLAIEWAQMNGLGTHTMYQDHKGNDFIINDGKVLKSVKTRPKHLKLVK